MRIDFTDGDVFYLDYESFNKIGISTQNKDDGRLIFLTANDLRLLSGKLLDAAREIELNQNKGVLKGK